jgi:hypothetical protein
MTRPQKAPALLTRNGFWAAVILSFKQMMLELVPKAEVLEQARFNISFTFLTYSTSL